MRLSDLRVAGRRKPRPASAADIAAAEAELGCPFPPRYAELMTTLGPGVLFGHVHVVGPREAVAERGTAEREFRVNEFGEEFAGGRRMRVANTRREWWRPAEFVGAVFLGRAGPDSGSLFFHPRRPGRGYALPYAGEVLHFAGADILDAARYVRRPFAPPEFTPCDWH